MVGGLPQAGSGPVTEGQGLPQYMGLDQAVPHPSGLVRGITKAFGLHPSPRSALLGITRDLDLPANAPSRVQRSGAAAKDQCTPRLHGESRGMGKVPELPAPAESGRAVQSAGNQPP